jgi:hypothetical protein
MSEFRNVFACLVHDSQECVIDLVRNLRYLDPASTVLLYNGGRDDQLLNHGFPFEEYGALIHPAPQPLSWGRLHDFALDCIRFALDRIPFDALTIVDSDQLAARSNYSQYLARLFAERPNVGLAGNSAGVQLANTRVGPAKAAFKELELWRPFLSRFDHGVEKFAHWVFWPSTVFSAQAARDVTRLFDTDDELRDIMNRSQIWASEEVIFPTLVALLGYDVALNPCTYDYVRHRVLYTRRDLDRAFVQPSVFWIHPVNRRYDDPLRAHVRTHFNHYERSHFAGGTMAADVNDRTQGQPLLLTWPILERMRGIEGWLDDDEADLLIAATTRACVELPGPPVIVEVGSYCGRSTVVFGSTLKTVAPEGRVYAVDPHDGVVGSLDSGLRSGPSTLPRFERNVAAAGVQDVVNSIQQRSFDVKWEQPISLLFIDGLHDYANVARDFYHFEPNVVPAGYVAFHDYADYYPGVKTFVNELLVRGAYERVALVRSTMLVRKRTGVPADEARVEPDVVDAAAEEAVGHAAAPVIAGLPRVSCVMPTWNRGLFVPQAIRCFLGQDYPNKELVIIDDGDERVEAAVPPGAPIRYVAIDRRLTLGEKRNVGVEMSAGDVIAHWDDDDWYAPGYLTRMVREVVGGGVGALAGVSRYLVLMLETGELRMCRSGGPAGATFCFHRELWARHRYRSARRAEDYFFLQDARPAVLRVDDPELFAVVRHRGHTWTSDNGGDVDRRLAKLPIHRRSIEAVLGAEHAAFYTTARTTLFPESVSA